MMVQKIIIWHLFYKKKLEEKESKRVNLYRIMIGGKISFKNFQYRWV